MARYYVLINEAGVYTKEGTFFESHGGLTQEWGKNWRPIEATSLYDARNQGIALRRIEFPSSHRTLGEGANAEAPDSYWPEAKGS
jgi:hypothetical protein